MLRIFIGCFILSYVIMFYNHVTNVNTIRVAEEFRNKLNPFVSIALISLISAIITSVVIALPVLIGLKLLV